MNPQAQADIGLLALVLWREARGEDVATKRAVAWSIRNRVANPGWWGKTWWGVILMPEQYSSFNHNDPNATKWPLQIDPSWEECLSVAISVYTEDVKQTPSIPDPTSGATSYFDRSMDSNPPSWALDRSMKHVLNSGNLRFYAKA